MYIFLLIIDFYASCTVAKEFKVTNIQGYRIRDKLV